MDGESAQKKDGLRYTRGAETGSWSEAGSWFQSCDYSEASN